MSTDTPNVGQTITVDTNSETVELQFVDDRNNQTDPPAGASVNWSDPGGAVTFNPDPSNPFKAQVVPVGTPGYARITAQVVGFSAPDGSPVPNPDPVELGVTPGAAVGERLVVSDSGQSPQAPAPAPATPDNPQPQPTAPTDPNTPADPNAPAPAPPTAPDPNAPGTTTPDPSTPTAPAPAPDAPAPDAPAPAPATDPNAPADPNATAPAPAADPSSGGSTSPADGGTAPSVASTDDLQRSVYTFSGDASQVDGNTWPASGYTTGDTGDGNNYPLYYYVGDEVPGQATGNGLEDGAWNFYTGPVSASGSA
jgi:hypothetical protein